MKDSQVIDDFNALLGALRLYKPNDRSDRDRYWAITITEVEKARAVFLTYAEPLISESVPGGGAE